MIKVLFLPAWYPNRYDAMAGLFVQKHAVAASLYADIKVLYIYADNKINNFEISVNKHQNVEEIIVYYPVSHLFKISKTINYFRALYKGLGELKRKKWNYQIVHLHIIRPSGFFLYLTKLLTKKPYFITEHWSRYLTTENTFQGKIDEFTTKLIVKNAQSVMVVSNVLKNGMIANGLNNLNYSIINNVVEDFFSLPKKSIKKEKKTILHISCFDEAAKNIQGILRSIKKLSAIRTDFELIIIGAGTDFNQIVSYCNTLNFSKNTVHFLGEKTPKDVAEWFQKSDMFVLFSNYETAGVVISESLLSGVPVISTKVGIAPEIINESNGILIDVGDENALTNSMNYILGHLEKYNSSDIQNGVRGMFSYEKVGKEMVNAYKNALKV